MRKFHIISDEQQIKDFQNRYSGWKIEFPRRATKHSAGYDFFLPFNIVIHPKVTFKIPTGIKVEMESDDVLKLYPRSSLGFKYGLELVNTVGIIDSDYFNNEDNEGHIWLKMYNPSDEIIELKQGTAIMQGIFEKFLVCDDDSADEKRVGGIGSTK